MKFSKRLSAILFSLLLGASVFSVACGSADKPDSTGGTTTPPEDTTVTEWTIPEKSWSYSNRILYVRDLGMCTGPDAFVDTNNDTFKMKGTDLGFSFYDPELKRLYCAFGDTNYYPGGKYVANSNDILYTDNLNFTEGIKWTGALPGQNGALTQVTPLAPHKAQYVENGQIGDITSTHVTTTIPTGCLVLNGKYYIWYMEVGHFEDTGEWDVYRNCVVKSEDKGQTWAKVDGLNWVCKDKDEKEGIAPNFGQIYPLDGGDGYIYIYGIPGGRCGCVKLGRVKYEDVEDFEKYEYYKGKNADGTVNWRVGSNGLKSIKADNNSAIVVPMCAELSICYNPYLRRYVMTYMQNNAQIVIRRSQTPWGEWSDGDIIMTQSDMNGLYGGISHSALMDNDGKRMYLFVSDWGKYNVHFIEVVFK